VHAWSQPLLIGNPPEQRAELLPFVEVQRGTDGVVVFACNPPNLLQGVSAG
jgi:hypothetical protein